MTSGIKRLALTPNISGKSPPCVLQNVNRKYQKHKYGSSDKQYFLLTYASAFTLEFGYDKSVLNISGSNLGLYLGII